MINLRNKLFCDLDGLTTEEREDRRFNKIKDLGLLDEKIVAVFEEATQTVAHFLEAPIAILGVISPGELIIKSAVGLSNLGLMNQLAVNRKIPKNDSFSVYAIDSKQPLLIEDTFSDSFFSQSILAQSYGIRAYVGTPLITAENIAIGILAVMDLVPRHFTEKDIEFLNLTARWCLREWETSVNKTSEIEVKTNAQSSEKNLSPDFSNVSFLATSNTSNSNSERNIEENKIFKIKVDLLKEILQDLKSPLTSIIGMSSVLNRGIYGELNEKQKNYIEVITSSGENLSRLIDDIIGLDIFNQNNKTLKIAPVDLEMLCQQIISSLEKVATEHKQKLSLSIEPGNKIWELDKEKIRQCLHYLLISVISSAEANSEVRIHISRKVELLNISIWTSHSWLGEGLQSSDYQSSLINMILSWCLGEDYQSKQTNDLLSSNLQTIKLSYDHLAEAWSNLKDKNSSGNNRQILTLLLSCYLTQIHKGNISIQGSEQSGYSYVLQFSRLTGNN